MKNLPGWVTCSWLVVCCLGDCDSVVWAQAPAPRAAAARPSILQRYQSLLQAAQARGADTSAAEAQAAQSAAAIREGDRRKADELMRKAIDSLQSGTPTVRPRREEPVAMARPQGVASSACPVFLMAFTHHYSGPGGYYPSAAEVRRMGEFFVKSKIPGTLFFDGILVERLQQEEPALIRQIREWNLPIGYHGEETHGPYPVGSELLGEVYTLREAQGYQGPWSLTTGKDWDTAVKLVEERYSYTRPYRIDPTTRMLDRHQAVATDRSRIGGLRLVQQAFGKDVSMMPSHALESAPEGYAFRRMSKFGFDQPAVPVALHALKIFRIDEMASDIMGIAGKDESLFWYMGRIHCKGDETGEAGYKPRLLRQKLMSLDRSRPRLLLVGFSHINEAEGAETARLLDEEFFPANPGSCWVTGDTLGDAFEPEKAYVATAADQLALARAVKAGWNGRPPDMLTVRDRVYSLADAFEILARALAGRAADGSLPATVTSHAIYGPVSDRGTPLLVAPLKLTARGVASVAQRWLGTLDSAGGDWFVPAQLQVDGRAVNAAEFLQAMASAVEAHPEEMVVLTPAQLFPPYADLLQSVFKPQAVQPLCYTKGQLWTVKPVRLKSSPPVKADTARPTESVLATSPRLPAAIRVVFASNLESSGGCCREDPNGADLYEVEYDLATGRASGLKRLTTREGPDWFPALSPDGRFVAYDRSGVGRGGQGARHDVWLIDRVAGGEQPCVENARFPAFDSTGSFLYFSRRLRQEHQLLRVPLSREKGEWPVPGSEKVMADHSSGSELVEDPAPLPDNSAVVFHRKEAAQGAGVAIIPTAGGAAQALSAYDGAGHVSVSPDGSAVACTRSRDGRLLLIRRTASGWQSPKEILLSTDAASYKDDERFASVSEVRHSYVEWVTPEVLVVTSHGATGPREFKFARLYLLILQGDDRPPLRLDLSAAIEELAGKRGRDFCSADALPIR